MRTRYLSLLYKRVYVCHKKSERSYGLLLLYIYEGKMEFGVYTYANRRRLCQSCDKQICLYLPICFTSIFPSTLRINFLGFGLLCSPWLHLFECFFFLVIKFFFVASIKEYFNTFSSRNNRHRSGRLTK